jgi:limonene-1,2-epoxide hydrolase
MGKQQEAPVRELLRMFDEGDFVGNMDRLLAQFTEDATYHMSVPGREKLLGREAIATELARQAGDYKDCVCEILTVVSDDRFVVTERIDHVTMLHDGKRVSNPLLAIFEVNDDGKIVNWREYWDALSLSQRMGVDPTTMLGLMGIATS